MLGKTDFGAKAAIKQKRQLRHIWGWGYLVVVGGVKL